MSITQRSSNSFGVGFAAATLATSAWYFAIYYGTDLKNDGFLRGLAVGSGSLVAVGAALAVPGRSRRFGFGLAVGALVAAFAAIAAIFALLVLVVGS